ncbi:uncharacterized protein PFL1_00551 [Pseudozyma flocculosa PF-1]|uniref:uncharacterized protein n=1 Tax=Pseudozyma flocculosa PF-1 TaxID=1277687 RepID=UPI0004560679|nr:uncharacterized protein PFL1_00551 [Pseudozyma flocculosa PF-1]EPQ32355.1 hypothetical protein PFL1_00551 [Pseudozyma flocculosa PF-1]
MHTNTHAHVPAAVVPSVPDADEAGTRDRPRRKLTSHGGIGFVRFCPSVTANDLTASAPSRRVLSRRRSLSRPRCRGPGAMERRARSGQHFRCMAAAAPERRPFERRAGFISPPTVRIPPAHRPDSLEHMTGKREGQCYTCRLGRSGGPAGTSALHPGAPQNLEQIGLLSAAFLLLREPQPRPSRICSRLLLLLILALCSNALDEPSYEAHDWPSAPSRHILLTAPTARTDNDLHHDTSQRRPRNRPPSQHRTWPYRPRRLGDLDPSRIETMVGSSSSPDSTSVTSKARTSTTGSSRPSSGVSSPNHVFFNGKRISDPVFLNGTTGVAAAQPRRTGDVSVEGKLHQANSAERRHCEQLLEAPQDRQVDTPRRTRLRTESASQLKSKFSMSPDHRSRKSKTRLRDRKTSLTNGKQEPQHEQAAARLVPKSSFASFGFVWGARTRKEKLRDKTSTLLPPGSSAGTPSSVRGRVGIDADINDYLDAPAGASAVKRFFTPSRRLMRDARGDTTTDEIHLHMCPPAPSPLTAGPGNQQQRLRTAATWSEMPRMRDSRESASCVRTEPTFEARVEAAKSMSQSVHCERSQSSTDTASCGAVKQTKVVPARRHRPLSPSIFGDHSAAETAPSRPHNDGRGGSKTRSSGNAVAVQHPRARTPPTPTISLTPPRENSVDLAGGASRILHRGESDPDARVLERAVQICLEGPSLRSSPVPTLAKGTANNRAVAEPSVGRPRKAEKSLDSLSVPEAGSIDGSDGSNVGQALGHQRGQASGKLHAAPLAAASPARQQNRSLRARLKELHLLSRPRLDSRPSATLPRRTGLGGGEAAKTSGRGVDGSDGKMGWWASLKIRSRKGANYLDDRGHRVAGGSAGFVADGPTDAFHAAWLPSPSDQASSQQETEALSPGRRSEDLLARASPKLADESFTSTKSKSIDLIRGHEASRVVPIRPFSFKVRPSLPAVCVEEATPSRHEAVKGDPVSSSTSFTSSMATPASQRQKTRFMSTKRHPWLRQLVLQPTVIAPPTVSARPPSSKSSSSTYQTIEEVDDGRCAPAGRSGITLVEIVGQPPSADKSGEYHQLARGFAFAAFGREDHASARESVTTTIPGQWRRSILTEPLHSPAGSATFALYERKTRLATPSIVSPPAQMAFSGSIGFSGADEATETLSQLVESFDDCLTPLTMTPSSKAGSPFRGIGGYRRPRWTSQDRSSVPDETLGYTRDLSETGGWQRGRFNSEARSSIALSTVLSYASTEANSSFGDGEELQDLIEGIMAGHDDKSDEGTARPGERDRPSRQQRASSLPRSLPSFGTIAITPATGNDEPGGTKQWLSRSPSHDDSGRHRRSRTDSSVPGQLRSFSAGPPLGTDDRAPLVLRSAPGFRVATSPSAQAKVTVEVTPPFMPNKSVQRTPAAGDAASSRSRGLLEAFGLSIRAAEAEGCRERLSPPKFLLNDEPVLVVDSPDASPFLVSGSVAGNRLVGAPKAVETMSSASADLASLFDGFDHVPSRSL